MIPSIKMYRYDHHGHCQTVHLPVCLLLLTQKSHVATVHKDTRLNRIIVLLKCGLIEYTVVLKCGRIEIFSFLYFFDGVTYLGGRSPSRKQKSVCLG